MKRRKAKTHCKNGNQYFAKQQYEDAIKEYEIALQIYPKNSEARDMMRMSYIARGLAHYNSGKYNMAIDTMQRLLKINPMDEEAWLIIEMAYLQLGEYQKMLESSQKILEINPKSASTWNDMGVAYLELGEYKRAIESFQKALEIDPKQASTWANMAGAYCKLGEYKWAVESCQEALIINHNDAGAWNNMGNAYISLGEAENAIDCFKKVLELNPENAGVWTNMGEAYRLSGEYTRAIKSCEKALEIDPKKINTWHNMRVIYFDLENYNKVIECSKKALKIEPEDLDSWNAMGLAYGKLGNHYQEIECYNKALEIDPHYEHAKKNLEAALKNYPQYYDEKREKELGKTDEEKVVVISPPTKIIEVKRGYETAGQYVKVGIKVENTSPTTITGVKVLLEVPSGLELVNPTSGVIVLGVIMPNGSQGANFQLRPIRCVDDVIHATIVYRDAVGKSIKEDMAALKVRNICPMLTDEGVDKEQILISLRKGEIRKSTSSFKFRGDLKTAFIVAEARVRGLIQLDRDERFINAHYIASACYIGRTKYGKFDFATEITVCGKENEGLLTIAVYSEEEAILTGFFYEVLEDVRKSVEILEERVKVVDEMCPECGGKFEKDTAEAEGYIRCGLCETLLRLPSWERG